MIAASLLVAAVVAAYASLAMLSLSASTSGIVLGAAANVQHLVGSVGWHPPSVKDAGGYVVKSTTPTIGNAAVPISSITVEGRGPISRSVTVGNSSAKPLLLRVAVVGQRLGMTATFAAGGSTRLVPAHGAERVVLVTDPLQAGVINAELQISVPGSDLAPQSVPIYGTQSPEPPTGAVTATPAAGGAVDLSWNPSPSTGVTGYIVESSTDGTTFSPVGNPAPGTSAVEQTGTNATTFTYEVVAVAAGVTLPSAAAVSPPVITDSVGPAQPLGFPGLPSYIDQANVGSFGVNVSLPQSTSTGDTITVTLSSGVNGATLTQPAIGGSSPVSVPFPQVGSLPDGRVTVTATPTDSLGNPGPSFSTTIQKLTSGPDAPTSVLPSTETVTTPTLPDFAVAVATDAADGGDNVTVTVAAASGSPSVTTPPVNAPPGGGTSTIPVDLSNLPDGNYTVTATVTDVAGNTASLAGPNIGLDTSGPEKPTNFGIAAGPDNPALVINAQSQTAVTIAGHFADPLEDGETITISIDQGTPLPVDVVPGTQDFTLGPLDLSGLPDGQVSLKMKLTDSDGNVSLAWRNNGVKETSGPTGPSSVGVPAGDSNPAGYVNSATQSSATIVAGFDTPTDPGDQIALSVGGDSNFPVESGGSDQVIWNNLDLSQLSDGNVPIVVTITDAAGNSTTVSGTLIKDTQAPPAPVAAHVLGPPLDTIRPGEGSCVNVGVAFNQAPDSSDTVTVTLSDGEASVQGSTQAGDGHVTVGCIDASSLSPGSISVSVTVTDVAGNSTTIEGTTATKAGCHHGSE
jgi:large repetitive protein